MPRTRAGILYSSPLYYELSHVALLPFRISLSNLTRRPFVYYIVWGANVTIESHQEHGDKVELNESQ